MLGKLVMVIKYNHLSELIKNTIFPLSWKNKIIRFYLEEMGRELFFFFFFNINGKKIQAKGIFFPFL